MAKISGYLKDGAGQAVAQCIIILTALKTSNQVIEQIESYTTTKDGFYEINALTGQYEVTLTIAGHPPKKVGVITIYSDSPNGTLNDFLANGITNDDITPLLLSQLIEERKQAQTAAQSAQKSATQASSTLANVVKKTGDTMSGDFTINKETPRIYWKNKDTDTGACILSTVNDFRIYDIRDVNKAIFYYHYINKEFSFNGAIKINNKEALTKGQFGIGAYGIDFTNSNFDNIGEDGSGFYNLGINSVGTYPLGFSYYSSVIHIARGGFNDKKGSQIIIDTAKTRMAFRTSSGTGYGKWAEVITTTNSTIDANGFYKKASPVVRLVNPTSQLAIDACVEDSLQQVGDGFANDQAIGVQVNYLATGHYQVQGSLGFAKSGWYIETPQDANGNKKLFVEYDTDKDNVITVKTYENCFENGRFVAGEPMDIPDGRWIDIRLMMPETLAE